MMSRKKPNKELSPLSKLIDYAAHQEVSGVSIITKKEPSNSLKSSMVSSHNSTDFLSNRIDELSKVRNKLTLGKDISSLDSDMLYFILESASQISMVVRNGILEYKNNGYTSRRKELVENENIKISIPNNAILRVSLPPLIGRKFSGSYDIYWKTKIALEQFFVTESCPFFVDEKFLLIYKKYATNLDACFTCDNDNWEAKRVTNAISESLNYSDNAEHFSMMYTAVKSHINMVEATVIKLDDLCKFTSYLQDNNPVQTIETFQ